jgi:nucleotide-binding universal stress UspA family protein
MTAFQAAKPFSAHVEVLFVHRDPREAIPYSEMPLPPDVIQDIVDGAEEVRKQAANAARQVFSEISTKFGATLLETPAPLNVTTASYRETTGHLGSVLTNAAILSDLVVIPPLSGEGDSEIHDALVRVLTKVSRPALLCANAAPERFAGKVAIGWDGRDAAAKALVAAVPVLEKAESVELTTVGEIRPSDTSLSEARKYLALHDIRCSERVIPRGSHSIADTLVDAARNSGCDLLVVGGYGHSRLVESIFGGVTDSIVSHPQLPILMVH